MTNSSLAVNQALFTINALQGAGSSSPKSKTAEGTKFSDHLKKVKGEDSSDHSKEMSAGSTRNEPANQSSVTAPDEDSQSAAADKGESKDPKIYATGNPFLALAVMPQPGQILSAETLSDPALATIGSEEAALSLQPALVPADQNGQVALSSQDVSFASALLNTENSAVDATADPTGQSAPTIIKTAAAANNAVVTAQNAPVENPDWREAALKGMNQPETGNTITATVDNGPTTPDPGKIILLSQANAGSNQPANATEEGLSAPTGNQVPEADSSVDLSKGNQSGTDSGDQNPEEPDLHLNLKVGTAHPENLTDKSNAGIFSGLTEAVKATTDQGPAASIPEPARVIEQIVKQIEVTNQQNNTEITIQLKPEHLGKMMIQLSLEEGKVTARFITDSQEVKNLLDTNISVLKQNLEANGIKVEKTEINYQLNGGEDFNQHFSGSRQEMNQQSHNRGGNSFSFSDQMQDPEESYIFSYTDADVEPTDFGDSGNQLNYLI